jgi:hypothetical protein
MTIFAALTDRAGAWAGANGFRLMPSDPLHDAPATAEVTMRAGGNLVAIAYTWSHPADGPQDGLLVLGPHGDAAGVSAFWGDSWHQSPEPRMCTGTGEGGVITVGYEYAPGWRWGITVDATDPASLRLQMENVVPEDAAEGRSAVAYPVMVMTLRRSGSPGRTRS